MRVVTSSWIFWVPLSASFAALTAIFGKVGVEGVDADYATADQRHQRMIGGGAVLVALKV